MVNGITRFAPSATSYRTSNQSVAQAVSVQDVVAPGQGSSVSAVVSVKGSAINASTTVVALLMSAPLPSEPIRTSSLELAA